MKYSDLVFTLVISGFILLYGGSLMAEKFPDTPGIYEMELKMETGAPLRYALAVPAGYSPEKAVPLVMALHYGGPVSPYYGKSYMTLLVEPALRELAAIIAAPDCPAGQWTNQTSEAAVIKLIDHIREHRRIDEKKIVLTGFSLGGMGTWYLAARYPGLFCAALPMAADTDRDTAEKIKDIPLFVIHSTGDQIFPFRQVRETVEILKKKGASIHLEIVEDISHYQTAAFTEPLKKAIPWLKEIWKK